MTTPESSENRETVGSATAESVAARASELPNLREIDWNSLGLRFLTTPKEWRGVCCSGTCGGRPCAEIDTPLGRGTYCPKHIEDVALSVFAYIESEAERV